ncbi:hypothetical protein V5P93_006883 [Actinokineospora auranticolor]|uniref:Uncharacterized protein n=1 Tax=Actinokineospora auranticolor TaxID=155976 RepID=A0A2S6GW53_9PSEU|nr:hypothetical protein [Actinokineospora auranticolor]PPK69475.1 hypothetical protein CLV40_10381 [Actinokineospora auranticolor]
MRRPVLWCVLSFLLGAVVAAWLLRSRGQTVLPLAPPRPPLTQVPLAPAEVAAVPADSSSPPEPAEADEDVVPVHIPAQTREEDEITRISGTLDDALTAAVAPAGPGGLAPSDEYTVKGAQGVFHTTESPDYPLVTATVWFRTVADAERAGFAPWRD